MTKYQRIFMDYLNRRRISYSVEEENFVRIVYRGIHMQQIPLLAYFDPDKEQLVSLLGTQIARFNDDNFVVGLGECNDASSRSDFIRFRLDNDMEVLADYDMKIRDDSFCEDMMQMLGHMAATIDRESIPLQKAMWE